MAEQKVGIVTHYFSHLHVAAVQLTDGPLRVGDQVRIRGHTSDFCQAVESIQIEHESLQEAKVGDEVGIQVVEHVREHDEAFVVTED